MPILSRHRTITSRELQAALPGARTQFNAISRQRRLWRWDNLLPMPRGSRWLRPLAIGTTVIGGAYLAILLWSPWPLLLTVRHILAAPNCEAAHAVGLAPAAKGSPGYWARNDRDKDGWSCEPLPRWKTGSTGMGRLHGSTSSP
jgi:hypothetical protein